MRVHRRAIGWGLALSLVVSSIAAPARAQSLQDFAEDITQSFTSLSKLVTAGSYLAGLGYSVIALLQLKMHQDRPSQIPIDAPVGLVALALSKVFQDSMSCTVFAGESTLLAEDTCVWTRIGVAWDRSGGASEDSAAGRVGGQLQVGPGWFLGGTLGIGGSQMQTAPGLQRSGRSVDASLVLKRVDGPLFLAGALALSTSSEQYSLSGNGSVYIPGTPINFMAGVRMRGAYELPFDGWYLRPRTDVDIGFARNSGLQVIAPTGTLTIDSAGKTAVMFTPALEIGGRFDAGPARILRPYVVVGATILTDSAATISGNFNGYSFSGTSYGPSVIARAEAGLQLYEVKGWEMKLEYLISTTTSFVSQSVGMRAAKHF